MKFFCLFLILFLKFSNSFAAVVFNGVFDDDQYKERSKKYEILNSFPPLPISTESLFSRVDFLKGTIAYEGDIHVIKPKEQLHQYMTQGIMDCVAIVLRKDTGEVFASHVTRNVVFGSLESDLDRFLSNEERVTSAHLVSLYTSDLMLKIYELLTNKKIAITTITRPKLPSGEHLIFESGLSNALRISTYGCRIYHPSKCLEQAVVKKFSVVNSSLACPPIVDYSGNLFGSPWVCWSMGSSVTVSGSNLTFDSTYGLNDNFYASCSVFVDAKNGEIIASRAGGAQIGNA
jgi:hypothetical protein